MTPNIFEFKNQNILKSVELEGIRFYAPDLTQNWGDERFDACLVCLDYNGHNSGVIFEINGVNTQNVFLEWTEEVTDKLLRTWRDIQEATEKGAEGIAVLLIKKYTPYKIIERAAKGTGIDYWLSEQMSLLPFQHAARLEVSGQISKNNSRYKAKIRQKQQQTQQSDYTQLPVYVVVVEFGTPQATLIKR